MQVDAHVDGRDARLRRARERLVALLVLGLQAQALVAAEVRVENVRVVEDPAAGGGERERGDAGDRPRRRTHARRRGARAVAPAAFAPAHPERVREHEQKRREREPVEPEPEDRRQEVAPPVHV